MDLRAIPIANQFSDPVGHYSRPEVFPLTFNRRANSVVSPAEKNVGDQESTSATDGLADIGETTDVDALIGANLS